jgi:uncharacterized damage-inducible protein DinB
MTTMAAPALTDALITQLKFCHGAAHMNLEGLSEDESRRRPDPGGNSVNWILGHITCVRHAVLHGLGETVAPNEKLAQYRRGSSGEPADPLPLADLIALFDELQPMFVATLQKLSESDLAGTGRLTRTPAGRDATLGNALASLVFHESYHVGQLGVARRLLGKEGAIK